MQNVSKGLVKFPRDLSLFEAGGRLDGYLSVLKKRYLIWLSRMTEIPPMPRFLIILESRTSRRTDRKMLSTPYQEAMRYSYRAAAALRLRSQARLGALKQADRISDYKLQQSAPGTPARKRKNWQQALRAVGRTADGREA